jgi:proline iminopeptidase
MATSTLSRQRSIAAPHVPPRMWIGLATAGGLGAVIGFAVAHASPRGPITAGHALSTMLLGLTVGAAAGFVARSRWASLLTPLGFLAAFELARRGLVSGPSVDAVRLDTFYGVLGLVLGHLVLVVCGVLPVLVGTLFYRWRIVPIVLTVGLAGLGIAALQPASTPTIAGQDGRPLHGSIASVESVRIGGHEQWIMLRGHDTSKPVLLYLSGGPGQSDLPFVRVLFQNLEPDFLVVGWDQRGTGKSYTALDPTSTLTLEQAISDTIELSEYLRIRFDEPRIYLIGESWGSTLAVLAAQRRPDLYFAVIGSGQMVSQRETDRRLFYDVLAYADSTGNPALAQKMQSFGEPPYGDVFASGFVMQQYEYLYKPYTPPESVQELGARAAWELGPWGVLGREYTLVEKVNVMRGLMDMFALLYPQLQGIDFRRDVPALQVPYVMLDGAAELTARRDLALEWYAQLEAPQKRIYTFENSAHAVAQEQFVAFRQIMLETIVPETYR